MAGHSHWAGIKYKKAANDAKRAKLFSKLSKAVMIAARDGADPDFNAKLRGAVDQARAGGMPKDNIERAIKKGAGLDAESNLTSATYEAYGTGGVALIIECLTDNMNRTFPEVKKIIESHGGKLGGQGSVAWMFQRKGLLSVSRDTADEETIMEIAIEAGADDVADAEDVWEIVTSAEAFDAVRQALAAKELPTNVSELTLIADNEIEPDEETALKALRLMDALDEHDDVQNVYSNFNPTVEQVTKVTG